MPRSQASAVSPAPNPPAAPAPPPAPAPIDISASFLTEEELAKQLGRAISTLRRWAALRKGPPRSEVSRKFYYSRKKLEEWIEAQAFTIKGR
ncbi:MAG: helix-turn-helix domain-containing protein [Candidatus Sulfotelmatobacter sp.]